MWPMVEYTYPSDTRARVQIKLRVNFDRREKCHIGVDVVDEFIIIRNDSISSRID